MRSLARAPQAGTIAYAIERMQQTQKTAADEIAPAAVLRRRADRARAHRAPDRSAAKEHSRRASTTSRACSPSATSRDDRGRERAHNESQLRARVTSLWQTRMLRDAALTVGDEIENALSYYRATFLDEIPALYADIESRARRSTACAARLPPFLQMGSWIGGDRDGNPNVTAETLERAITRAGLR